MIHYEETEKYNSYNKLSQTGEAVNVLGELQFAFVCFLIGQVYDAFEQWKLLINLLCNCETAIARHPNLFNKFIQCIYFQLKEMPDDFFTDLVTRNNFLTLNLHNFFDNCKQESSDYSIMSGIEMKHLTDKCEQFKSYLQEKFKMNFEAEPDEYAPVVVTSDD